MTFGLLKQNLSLGDFVTIGQMGSPDEPLEGMQGRILGLATETAECDFYIVMLSKALPNRAAVVIIESCLSKIPTPPWSSEALRPLSTLP